MMLRTKRERRAAPAAQQLSGLENCLEMFFAKRCSRNIALLVEPLSNVSWKDSPRVAAVAPLVDLCRLYQIGTYSSCKLVDPPVKRVRAKPTCADIVPKDDVDATSSSIVSQFVSMGADAKREFVRAKLVKRAAVNRKTAQSGDDIDITDVAAVGVGVATYGAYADGEVAQPARARRPMMRVCSKSKPVACKAGELHAASTSDAISALAFKDVAVPMGVELDKDRVV